MRNASFLASWTRIGLNWFPNCPSDLVRETTIVVLKYLSASYSRLRFFLSNWSRDKSNEKRTRSKLHLIFKKISFDFALVLNDSPLYLVSTANNNGHNSYSKSHTKRSLWRGVLKFEDLPSQAQCLDSGCVDTNCLNFELVTIWLWIRNWIPLTSIIETLGRIP